MIVTNRLLIKSNNLFYAYIFLKVSLHKKYSNFKLLKTNTCLDLSGLDTQSMENPYPESWTQCKQKLANLTLTSPNFETNFSETALVLLSFCRRRCMQLTGFQSRRFLASMKTIRKNYSERAYLDTLAGFDTEIKVFLDQCSNTFWQQVRTYTSQSEVPSSN